MNISELYFMGKGIFKRIIILGITVLLQSGHLYAQQHIGKKIQITWCTSNTYDGKDDLGLKLVLKNISNSPVDLKKWDLWFNSMFPILENKGSKYQLTHENGNLFKLAFTDQVIGAHDSLVFDYQTQFPIANISTVPNGFYFQDKKDIYKYYAVNDVVYKPIRKPIDEQKDFYTALYEKNDRLNRPADFPFIFPTPLSMHVGDGFFTLPEVLTYSVDKKFINIDFLLTDLKGAFQNSLQLSNEIEGKFRIKYKAELAREAYNLVVNEKGITIEASDNQGVFYAIQSLKSMLPPINSTSIKLKFVSVNDKPRFAYRGFMLDIVRNFKSKEVIKKYLDVMAAYKLNVFHFHLIDDEGWRIEISSLPELTEVGATRSPSFMDGNTIHPAYGSGAIGTDKYYLSRADFIEILKYANERFITVIPEIETPGHARAAIKSMEARYHRLMALGKETEAKEYLLHDLEDQSVYNSAQNFNDNILNPALPSVYTFINTVLDDFKAMYDDAGLILKTVSLGGDEVPLGVWERSPKIIELMNEKGFTSVHQVWPYYINRINEICRAKGLVMAGWEEIGMVNKGEGMVVNKDFPDKQNMLLDVWNNVIGGGQEDLAYRLANDGYPVVLLSSSNMYFDMMWNTNFMEPGLKWATYADLYHAYSFLPEDYFANIDTYYSGKELGKAGFKDRVRLTEKGKRNLRGIKGGLFTETVHSESKLDYMVFPRFFTLVERAWAPKKAYESEESFATSLFEMDYTQFLNRIATVDLPKLKQSFEFRLPTVGIKLDNGVIRANTEYPNFAVYYTTDGTIPTLKSDKYDANNGVKLTAGAKYVFAVIDTLGRVGQLTYFN